MLEPVRGRHTDAASAAYSRAQLVGMMTGDSLLTVPVIAALILVVLGLFADQEAALYLRAVGLVLFLGALTLLMLVLSQRRPQTAADPEALPATGGSNS